MTQEELEAVGISQVLDGEPVEITIKGFARYGFYHDKIQIKVSDSEFIKIPTEAIVSIFRSKIRYNVGHRLKVTVGTIGVYPGSYIKSAEGGWYLYDSPYNSPQKTYEALVDEQKILFSCQYEDIN